MPATLPPEAINCVKDRFCLLPKIPRCFSILGTTYGGNGQTTFGLPDLRGRAPIGQGQGPGLQPYVLGQMAGSENTALTTNQMPQHTHPATSTLYGEGDLGSLPSPVDHLLGASTTNIYAPSSSSDNQAMSSESIVTTVGIAGGSQPFSVLSPYLAINYIICTEGIFPSRN